MTTTTRKPSYEDLLALAHMIGASDYDALEDVATRVLDGYPADEQAYLTVALPEMTIGATQEFRSGAAVVTRVNESTWRVDDHHEPAEVSLADAAEWITVLERSDA